jgi:hypothetical protein
MVADSASTAKSGSPESGSRGFVEPDGGSLNDIGKNVGRAYAAGLAYLTAQADRLRVAVRNLVMLLILAALGAVIVGTIVVSATVLLMIGIAQSISALLGNRPWAGDLITGAIVVSAVALTAYVILARMARAARLRTLARYQNKAF